MKQQQQVATKVERATDTPTDRSPFALGLMLRRAHDRTTAALGAALQPFDLELRHFAVLITINRCGPLSQAELSAETGNDKSAMVRVVDDLERRGMVERRPVSGDRRLNAIAFTEQGLNAFDAIHEAAADISHQLVAHLEPGEDTKLLDLLTRYTYPPTGD